MNELKASDDLVGMRFGRWTVLHRVPNRNNEKYYRCVCDCGTIRDVYNWGLRTGDSKSCGCLSAEMTGDRSRTHGYTSDEIKSRIVAIWRGMHDRCYNTTHISYSSYGGAGITICNDWNHTNPQGLENFINWSLKNGYQRTLSIDRIDGSRGYSPDNCRWTTKAVQGANKKKSKCNTVGFIGVSKHRNKFQARLVHCGSNISIGEYTVPETAAIARNNLIHRLKLPHTLNPIVISEDTRRQVTNGIACEEHPYCESEHHSYDPELSIDELYTLEQYIHINNN